MGPLQGWELLVLLLVFLIFIGPQRLPQYTRNIVRGVRKVRHWVDESRESVESEMGIAVDDLRKYDPRQYDPRRIIREAWDSTEIEDTLNETKDLAASAVGAASASGGKRSSSSSDEDEGPLRAPFDDEAT